MAGGDGSAGVVVGKEERPLMKIVVEIDTKLRNSAIIWGLKHGLDIFGARGGVITAKVIQRILKEFLTASGDYSE